MPLFCCAGPCLLSSRKYLFQRKVGERDSSQFDPSAASRAGDDGEGHCGFVVCPFWPEVLGTKFICRVG